MLLHYDKYCYEKTKIKFTFDLRQKKFKEGSWALGGRESLMELHVESVAWMFKPWCTVHRGHTVVRLCSFVGSLVCQILHISVTCGLQVLKVGQHAKSEILAT